MLNSHLAPNRVFADGTMLGSPVQFSEDAELSTGRRGRSQMELGNKNLGGGSARKTADRSTPDN